MAELVVTQEVSAPAERTWELLTDWDAHDRWMLLTRASGGRGAGQGIRAFTGLGRIGFTDTMTITVWDPPERAVVRHTGRVVRGAGAFEVQRLGEDRSKVVWSEWVVPPFGAVGALAWPVVRPALRWLVQVSLRRLARLVESGR